MLPTKKTKQNKTSLHPLSLSLPKPELDYILWKF